MRCGVVQTNARAARFINLRLNAIADTQMTCCQLTDMANSLAIFLCILNAKFSILPFQQARIAYLAARFTVKGRFIQYHNRFLACSDLFYRDAVNVDRLNGSRQVKLVIAFKG